jgi:hypothetical protein
MENKYTAQPLARTPSQRPLTEEERAAENPPVPEVVPPVPQPSSDETEAPEVLPKISPAAPPSLSADAPAPVAGPEAPVVPPTPSQDETPPESLPDAPPAPSAHVDQPQSDPAPSIPPKAPLSAAAPTESPPAETASSAPSVSELARNLQVPDAVVANNYELAQSLQREIEEKRNKKIAEMKKISPPQVNLPVIDYGVVAQRFNMDRSIGTISSEKTKAVFDAMLAFSDNPDQRRATSRNLLLAIEDLRTEDPDLARKFYDKYTNYLVDHHREPGMEPMTRDSVHKLKDDRLGRFIRSTSVGAVGSSMVGRQMEKYGMKFGPKVLHILTRPFTLPWAIYAGFDEVSRQNLEAELKRRKDMVGKSPEDQLDLTDKVDFSGADEALKSVLAIRNVKDLDAAVAHAQVMIEQLKPVNADAAAVLKKLVDTYIENPANARVLMSRDEIQATLDGGSSFENYVTMAGALADWAMIGAWMTSAEVPWLAPVATGLTAVAGASAVYRGLQRQGEEDDQEWYTKEMERRKQLEYHVDEQGNPAKAVK